MPQCEQLELELNDVRLVQYAEVLALETSASLATALHNAAERVRAMTDEEYWDSLDRQYAAVRKAASRSVNEHGQRLTESTHR